jgi:hypothetical protein
MLFVRVEDARRVINRLGLACNILLGTRFHSGEDLKLDHSGRWVDAGGRRDDSGRPDRRRRC